MASEGDSHDNTSLVVDAAGRGDACRTSVEWNVSVGTVQTPLRMNKHTRDDTPQRCTGPNMDINSVQTPCLTNEIQTESLVSNTMEFTQNDLVCPDTT
eukprot:14291252-Ditylum_brightwellii.AAC.1